MNAIIVDDEKLARETLAEFVKDYTDGVRIVGLAQNIDEAYELIMNEKPDLVFLDIEMPGGNAFDLLERIEHNDFEIIFTTAHGHYAIQAIKFSALDFILKPLDIEELKNAVNKAKEKRKRAPIEDEIIQIRTLLNNLGGKDELAQIIIPEVGGFKVINTSDIIYCQSDKSYCEIYTTESKLVSSKSLKEYDGLLADNNFFRVNKSFLINLKHVKEYKKGEGGTAIMSNGYEIEVSRRRKKEFIAEFSNT